MASTSPDIAIVFSDAPLRSKRGIAMFRLPIALELVRRTLQVSRGKMEVHSVRVDDVPFTEDRPELVVSAIWSTLFSYLYYSAKGLTPKALGA